jgi:thymidylate synthase
VALTYDPIARHATIDNLTGDYVDLGDLLVKHGQLVKPRNVETLEIEDFSLFLTDPTMSVPVGVGRKLSLKILAAEGLQWLGGFSDLAQLSSVSKGKFDEYSDDGQTLYGAYGPRTALGLERAVDMLARDRSSRQAVVPIWRPLEVTRTKDLPCTLSWSFRIRGVEHLHMSTVMRSNDVFTGVAYDVPIMCRIGDAVAFALDAYLDAYHHTAQSFHQYVRDNDAMSALCRQRPPYPAQPPMFTEGLRDWIDKYVPHQLSQQDVWELIRNLAVLASHHNHTRSKLPDHDELPYGFAWWSDQLKGHRCNPYYCPKCRYYLPSDHLCLGVPE